MSKVCLLLLMNSFELGCSRLDQLYSRCMVLWDAFFILYLALTAHWISGGQGDKPLSLRTALIRFHWLKQKHTGKNIAQNILHLLDRAGITAKVTFVMFWYSVAY
jgi:hypothetical protein